MAAGARTLLLWCPDWPVIAAEIVEGVPASGAVVVLQGNRVVACSEAARAEGVRRGLRRREAQSRCPRLVVVEHDAGRDARAFEAVVAAVEEVAVGVEVIRPGACALAARGPARYFGGEEAAAERIVEQVAEACSVESQVGIADGVFAAGLAARAGRLIAPGETPAFLAGMPIETIERPELVDLVKRLGIATLGDFAALPPGDVLTRFGFDGALAHRLAGGHDHRPLAVRKPPPDLDVSDTYDEPLERVDVAAFAGRVLAERLHDRLAAHGLACTRLGIEAVTADGQELHRVWRHDGMLTAAAIAERVRWQMDGWLTGARRGAPARPTAGLVRLRLIPDGVLVHLGLQPGLWGDAGADRERAHRAFSRVQGLLGPDSVLTPVLGGGRSADDQVRLIPWGDERDPHRPTAPHADPIPDFTFTPLQPQTPNPAEVRPQPAEVTSEGRTPQPARSSAPTPVTRLPRPAHPSPPPEAPTPEVAARNAAPQRPAPSGVVAAAQGVAAQGVMSQEVAVPGVAAQRVTSQEVAAQGVAAQGVMSQEVAVPGVAAQRVTSQEVAAQEVAAQGAMSQEVAALGVTAQRVISQEVTVPGVTAQGVMSQEVAALGLAARGVTVPGVAVPGMAVPGMAVPEVAVPGVAVPGVVVQEVTVPGVAVVAVGAGRRVTGGRRLSKPPVLPPWPGRLPKPAPAIVLAQPLPAVVLDDTGALVGVSARLDLTGDPAALVVGRSAPIGISGWAGPWPVDERWWAAEEGRRRARFQVVLEDGRALLLALAGGHWMVEAIYD